MKRIRLKAVAIKKKRIVSFIFIIVFVVASCLFPHILSVDSPKARYTIVIDAGHGGIDGGAVGTQTKIEERDLNLIYAKTLKRVCEEFGFKVVLTRSDENGLYSPLAKNKKKSEMQKRQDIIESVKPDLLVSIHMNSFPKQSCRGAQVFYAESNEGGMLLAQKIQESLHAKIEFAKSTPKVGDYYVLNCTRCAGVLIECGFLSNKEEEMLLQQKEYINDFCYQVFCGILQFFKM